MSIQVSLGKQVAINLQRYAETPERELFYYLINSDEYVSVLPRAKHLVEGYLAQTTVSINTSEQLPQWLESFEYTPEAFSARMETISEQNHTHLQHTLTPDQSQYILCQQAPAALLDGAWLQNISLAANCHDETIASLFCIYTQKIGDGNTRHHYGNLYRDLLRSGRVYLPEINTRLFTTHRDIQGTAFQKPVFELALSLFPRVYLPELIGYTLGHLVSGQHSVLLQQEPALKSQGVDTRYIQQYHESESLDQQVQHIQSTVMKYLAQLDDTVRQAHWQRIWSGLVTHDSLSNNLRTIVHLRLDTPQKKTPHQKMLEMVIAKAPHARNMHRNKRFGKRYINDWFADEPFDAEGFLNALIASPYVNQKSPEKSQLITRSVAFGGPMFRIFTDAEMDIMEEWVHSLSEGGAIANEARMPPVALNKPDVLPPPMPALVSPDLATYAKSKKRDLYYYFVNADVYPDVMPTAKQVAAQYFKEARTAMNKRKLPPLQRFFVYSHDAFESRIQQIYQSETNAYQRFVAPSTVPREIMVWFTQQYAAFTMVDGSWVQNIAKAGMSHTDISARLFRIYSDEVGNADTAMNHPNVYRRLLEGEGIHMPPTASREFSMQPELLDFSFDLPLLTLSISMFPKAMLPEIIGVNLAIELSGLGKDYMTIIDELNYWKVDSYFFTLHLTIDNIASGHTAVAMETVHLYLDQVLTTQGHDVMQREWERIWVAYLAFTRVAKKFETTLETKAGFKFIGPLISLTMKNRKAAKLKNG
ncbi:iron-containing redox enzyme family protein [Leucothrix arctica]|uniref:Iron-containing redox enzyme family protein n=1 Tax=Leucothrix arctica TaxID=1481894 RepID=A0A317CS24_9GAMM|nr:iron-containing redox enzyme family protein [Leucothrix arctica]PWQ99240.1 hypothetical protein DKT75_01455 [Leucothrix arctica]